MIFLRKFVRKNKKKEKAPVVRFSLNIKTKKLLPKKKCVELKDTPKTNNCVYSSTRYVPVRALVKTVKRDLVPTALRKLYVLYNFKKHCKHPRKEKK